MGRLADAIEAASNRHGGVECNMLSLLRQMPPEDQQDVIAALKDTSVQATRIMEQLDAFGYSIGIEAIRKHRNRLLKKPNSCRCRVDG